MNRTTSGFGCLACLLGLGAIAFLVSAESSLLLVVLLAMPPLGLLILWSAPASNPVKMALWLHVGAAVLVAAFWAVSWLPVGVVVGLALTLAVTFGSLRWWKHNPHAVGPDVPVSTCQICGYDLRASLERCPECGADLPEDLARRRRMMEEIRRRRAAEARGETAGPPAGSTPERGE